METPHSRPAQSNLREIFLEALGLPAASQREAFLDRACQGNEKVRATVEALLRSHRDDDFLEGPSLILDSLDFKDSSFRLWEGPGTRIGRYRLLEQIGEGGFGVVFMAEQEEPVHRKVALKIIKLGMDSKSVVARFEAERQALALMDHPNIAKVLDGGATETGRPYFVMELVQGVPITEFCGKNQLTIEERVRLFLPICQAIQSAHQKGIIHRDLKPSNVLVTLHDGISVPKVIDFGVAKATKQKLTERTLFTNFATMIGTPLYMSPEQAEMSGLDVDTRTDIYSLGVLLYELLAGVTPISEEQLRSVSYAEMQRIIVQEEPERPSARLRKTILTSSAGRLPMQTTKLASDLDWIVMKCLEKDRKRRYETANGLAADIQRYLGNEPIVARPPSPSYRLQKAIRRNRFAFAAAGAIAATLVAGILISSWQAVRARRAERAQERERALAERRLQTTLGFVNRIYQEVSLKLWQIVGTAQANEMLVTNGLAFLDQLREGREFSPQFRTSLGYLYLRLAQSQGWPQGNTTADYESGLRCAKEAIRLLTPDSSEVPVDGYIRQLARAEMVAGMASERLFLAEEAMAHFREASRWAARLTNSPGFGSEALTLRSAALGGCIGDVLLEIGRVNEALTNHFLPFLSELEARGVSDQSDAFDFGHLGLSHMCLGRAYSALNRPAEALVHRREALRIAEGLLPNNPKAAEFLAGRALATAELGESLLALNLPEGETQLHNALEQAGSLIALDQINAGLLETRIEVLRVSAQGRIAWAAHPSATLAQSRARLIQAQGDLAEADQRIGELRSDPQRRWLRHGLERTRCALCMLQTSSDSSNDRRPRP